MKALFIQLLMAQGQLLALSDSGKIYEMRGDKWVEILAHRPDEEVFCADRIDSEETT